ncbi:MAG: peptidase T [Firmicutes bacterium]|nr:peptidase T [Bacillota bacterium]
MRAYERLLNYVKFNTQSSDSSKTYPSTSSQLELANFLKEELTNLGVSSEVDDFGYLIGRIKANTLKKIPCVAFIAHLDTSPDASGENVLPRLIQSYDGKDIVLNEETNIVLSPTMFSSLIRNIGEDLIVTDGTTLLGADDKAGVAEIMTVVEFIQTHSDFIHGEIVIVFTPDEEVGNGTIYLDVNKVNADFAYTLDGSMVGEIAYENFNAAGAKVIFNGKSVHPGSAKNKMINSIELAFEFNQLLPKFMRPEITENYEGFNHLHGIQGNVEKTVLDYIIRNHDKMIFESQKKDFLNACEFINNKYGKNTSILEITDSYFNMKEKLDNHLEIIDIAIKAITDQGLTPIIEPIRGGTDGARLTYMGLPCPNLGTGGYNYHGPFEYISIQEMDQAVEIVKKIITNIYELT